MTTWAPRETNAHQKGTSQVPKGSQINPQSTFSLLFYLKIITTKENSQSSSDLAPGMSQSKEKVYKRNSISRKNSPMWAQRDMQQDGLAILSKTVLNIVKITQCPTIGDGINCGIFTPFKYYTAIKIDNQIYMSQHRIKEKKNFKEVAEYIRYKARDMNSKNTQTNSISFTHRTNAVRE